MSRIAVPTNPSPAPASSADGPVMCEIAFARAVAEGVLFESAFTQLLGKSNHKMRAARLAISALTELSEQQRQACIAWARSSPVGP